MNTKQILKECGGFSDECLAPVTVGTAKALCKQICQLEADLNTALIERNNAEKREYEVLGRANALEAELKATQARLVASDELLREEFAQRQDALTWLTSAQRQAYQNHLNKGLRLSLTPVDNT